MKKDRSAEVLNLATNLDLIMDNDGEKFVAFTSDRDDVNVVELVNEIATIYSNNKKVLVASYDAIIDKAGMVDYITIDAKKDDKDSMDAKSAEYDIVFVICPSMITSKCYLHMAEFVSDAVIVAKKWKSKTENIKSIKAIMESTNIKLLGLVYQK